MQLPLLVISYVFMGVMALLSAASIIWFLVRRKHKRVFLPTVKVLELERRVLPKFQLTVPPWLSFLAYLICCAALLLFSLQPKEEIYSEFDPGKSRTHIFLDYSPSVQASKPNVLEVVRPIWNGRKFSGPTTLGTSHSNQIFKFADEVELEKFLSKTHGHRAGLKLGSALKKQLDSLGEIDRLFIVSDADQHSWQGFNWSFLSDKIEVLWVDFGSHFNQENFFVQTANYTSDATDLRMEWEVEIARNRAGTSKSGVLQVFVDEQLLAQKDWTIPADKLRFSIRISWPKQLVPSSNAHNKSLIWDLGLQQSDAILADNTFRTSMFGMKREIAILGGLKGENMLADRGLAAATALRIQGFSTERFDTRNQAPPNLEAYPLVLLLGGQEQDLDSFCPADFIQKRSLPAVKKPDQFVWLIPSGSGSDFSLLCRCYHRLLKATSVDQSSPNFCQEAQSRDSYTGLLKSLGAKQVGGELGDAISSIAWSGRAENRRFQVIAFTLPLSPGRNGGFSHAMLPVLIKQMIGWHKLQGSDDKRQQWLRIEDLAKYWQENELSQIHLSNVPLAESLLLKMSSDALPPRWIPGNQVGANNRMQKKDHEDPLRWLFLISALVVVGMLLEMIGFVAFRPRVKNVLVFGIILLAGVHATTGRSEVKLSLLSKRQPGSVRKLAKEVSARTSIDLGIQPERLSSFTESARRQPWLWVEDVTAIANAKGHLDADVVLWLKRGGLLVIVNQPHAIVENLTSKLGGAGLQVIPPDHELMRSFYLLDSLPSCGQQVWQGFHLDFRLAILSIPYPLVEALQDQRLVPQCKGKISTERELRVFINLLMVALATDYKKDQIHLPEILKRLR